MDCTFRQLFNLMAKWVHFAWLIFWLLLVAASPAFWCYLSNCGPEWFSDVGWEGGHKGMPSAHFPGFVSCILFMVLMLFIAFAPLNNWYYEEISVKEKSGE